MLDDPSVILEPTLAEAKRVLQEMKKTKDLDARKTQSEILVNLCRSAGVFFDLISSAMMAEDIEGDWDENEDDEDDESL